MMETPAQDDQLVTPGASRMNTPIITPPSGNTDHGGQSSDLAFRQGSGMFGHRLPTTMTFRVTDTEDQTIARTSRWRQWNAIARWGWTRDFDDGSPNNLYDPSGIKTLHNLVGDVKGIEYFLKHARRHSPNLEGKAFPFEDGGVEGSGSSKDGTNNSGKKGIEVKAPRFPVNPIRVAAILQRISC